MMRAKPKQKTVTRVSSERNANTPHLDRKSERKITKSEDVNIFLETLQIL